MTFSFRIFTDHYQLLQIRGSMEDGVHRTLTLERAARLEVDGRRKFRTGQLRPARAYSWFGQSQSAADPRRQFLKLSSELRAEVIHRAKSRCEYCLLHEDDAVFPHEVDHIISRQHGGDETPDNLAYACMVCNRYKGSNIASLSASGGKRPVNTVFHRTSDLQKLVVVC